MKTSRTLTARAVIALGLALSVAFTLIGVGPLHGTPAHAQEPFDESEAGEIYYEQATRMARFRNYRKAMELFEKALPFMRDDADIYYNLVAIADKLKRFDKAYLYASAYLRLDSDSTDAREMLWVQKRMAGTLRVTNAYPAEVTLDIFPKGVELYANNVPIGLTGGLPVKLPPGTYKLTAEKTDYHPLDMTIVVEPRRPQFFQGRLEKIMYYGTLDIKTFKAPCSWPCQPLKAALEVDDKANAGLRALKNVVVYVNDTRMGESPLKAPIKLLSDRYLLRFEKDGYDSWSRYVEVPRNASLPVQPILERTPKEATATDSDEDS